jgi:hypothetical protein
MTMMATTTTPSATSAAGTSSLARASQSGRLESKTNNGGFEACFAGGLDLSEFGSTTTTTTGSISNNYNFNTSAVATSASAALLQIKAQESVEKRREEQEEFKMQAIVQKRAQSLNESATMNNNDDDGGDKVLWAAPPTASYGAETVDFTIKGKYDNNKNTKTKTSMLGALVGSMHGGDELNHLSKASRSKMKKDKRLQSVAKKCNRTSSTNNSKNNNKQTQVLPSKGRGVVKKSKRSKY